MHGRSRAKRARLLATALGLFLAATMVTVWLSSSSGAGGGGSCDGLALAAAQRAGQDTGRGPRVAVIGDSYAVGLGLTDPAEAWPSRLPGRIHVDGFSGSGFSEGASPCRDVSYADRAPAALRDAELVVVEGGLNDVGRSDTEIASGFAALMDAVGDVPVLVVGPPRAPARAEHAPHVDDLLAGLAERHGAAYLSTIALDLPYLDDDLHLTAKGHRLLGDAVAAELEGSLAAG